MWVVSLVTGDMWKLNGGAMRCSECSVNFKSAFSSQAIRVLLWHMPHGIILLTSPRNNDSCNLLFEQPFSSHFHTTPCISSYLWLLSHDLLAFTKSSHCHFSPRSKELTPLRLAHHFISIRNVFITTYASLPSHLSENSHHEYFKLSHTH